MKKLLPSVLWMLLCATAHAQRYNYFAPGGALSCTGSCTQQTVNLAAGSSFITGTLPLANILTCATTQIVFDSGGSLVCSAKFTWVDSTNTLSLGSATSAATVSLLTPNQTTANTAGAQLTIAGGNGKGSGAGAAVNLDAGSGDTTGVGGNLNLGAGNSGSSSGNAGSILALAGSAIGTNGIGGGNQFTAGNGAGTGAGGGNLFTGGTASGTAAGGDTEFFSGAGNGGATVGGSFILSAGAANAATAANVTLQPGQGADAAHSGGIALQDFNGDNTLFIDAFGNVVCACATTTSATDQFLYLGKSSGVPTGIPAHVTGVYANAIPVRYDTTDDALYAYNAGWVNVANHPTNSAAISYNATSATVPYQLNGTTVFYATTDPGGGFSLFYGQGAGTNAGVSSAAKGFFTCVGYQTCGGAGAGTINAGVNIEDTAFGWSAASKLTTGTFDTALGVGAMRNETTGSNNLAVGVDSMGLSVGTSGSTCVGVNTCKNGAGTALTAVGGTALQGQTSSTPANDIAIGNNAMSSGSLTNPGSDVVIGNSAGNAITSASNDTLIGFNTGQALTTGSNNTIIGFQVGQGTLTTGGSNILIGTSNATTTPAAGSSNEINIGNLIFYNKNSTVAPAVSACGTSPSIDSHANNRSGTVTVGTVAAASCTVTFAGTGYSTWNHCRVTSQSTIASFAYSYTLTTLTVTGTSLVSDLFDYDCDGY